MSSKFKGFVPFGAIKAVKKRYEKNTTGEWRSLEK
jgi:hypothetical protein